MRGERSIGARGTSLRALAFVAACAISSSVLACGVAAPPVTSTAAATHASRRIELYFGRNRDDRPGGVTDDEWDAFVAEVLTPAFPGLTVIEAVGVWHDVGKPVEHEKTKVVVIVVEAAKYDQAAIDAVCRTYLERFNQHAVLRVVSDVGSSELRR